MKTKAILLRLLAALALAGPLSATEKTPAQGHDHDHGHSHAKKVVGPNGGRLITGVNPHAEFLVTAERKVRITFVGEDGKPVAPAEQVVTVTAGRRASPTRLSFERAGDALLSVQPLPAGNDIPAVVQIKPAPGARTIVERFHLNLEKCPTCAYAEYACICGHD